MIGVFIQLNTEPGQHGKSNPIGYVICENGCWEWVGAKGKGKGLKGGYGSYHGTLAHRWMYEHSRGPIPEGMTIDHLCRNTLCVNPDHLEVVTGKVNTLRGRSFSARNAKVTHCPKGHLYDEKNTRFARKKQDGRIFRECRACGRARYWRAKQLLQENAP